MQCLSRGARHFLQDFGRVHGVPSLSVCLLYHSESSPMHFWNRTCSSSPCRDWLSASIIVSVIASSGGLYSCLSWLASALIFDRSSLPVGQSAAVEGNIMSSFAFTKVTKAWAVLQRFFFLAKSCGNSSSKSIEPTVSQSVSRYMSALDTGAAAAAPVSIRATAISSKTCTSLFSTVASASASSSNSKAGVAGAAM